MRVFRKILLWILIIVAAIVATVAIAASPVAKRYVEDHDTQLVGREVSVCKLRFNIFNGKIKFSNLTFFEADARTTFMTVDTFNVQCKLLKLLDKEVIISHAYIKSLNATLLQDGDSLNINDVIDFFTPAPDAPPGKWSVGLNDIKIRTSDILYKDLEMHTDLNINNLNLNVPSLYLSGDNVTNAGLEFDLSDNGHFKIAMDYGMGDSRFALLLNIKNLGIDIVAPYIRQAVNAGEIDGLLSADLKIAGSTSHFSQMTIAGDVSLADFVVKNVDDEQFAAISGISAGIEKIDLLNRQYIFSHATVSGVDVDYTIYEDGTDILSKILKSASTDESSISEVDITAEVAPGQGADSNAVASVQADSLSTETVSKTPDINLLIRSVEVSDGRVHYKDNSLHTPFEYYLTNISLRSRNLNLKERTNVRLSADLNNTGKLTAVYLGSLQSMANENINVEIHNLNMSDLSPYCEYYTAYPIESGSLSFFSKDEVRDYNLKSENTLNIHGLSVGKKIKKMKPKLDIPLKAAVYILEDKDDKVAIDLPVSGNIHSPEFSYKKIIFKTLGNLLVKVTVSPFTYIADALGLSSDKLAKVPVDPTSGDLSTEQTDLLTQISAQARERSQLQLILEQQFSADKACDGYSVRKLKEEYYAEKIRAAQNMPRTPRLTAIDMKAADDLSDKDTGLLLYVQSRLDSLGQSGVKYKNIHEASKVIYPDEQILSEIMTIAHRRDSLVLRYLGVENAIVRTLPVDSLTRYKGEGYYNVSFVLNRDVEMSLDLEAPRSENTGHPDSVAVDSL